MKLNVNARTYDVSVPENTPLLWVIREELGLTGTKFGCGRGLCGACTVHLDGTAIRSCITPVSVVSAGHVTTIEGLGTEHHPHPLQAAWAELNVAQCGYCQSGQLMSAAALLKQNPHATSADIEGAMAGNLCRCGTYVRIRDAIQQVASKNKSGR